MIIGLTMLLGVLATGVNVRPAAACSCKAVSPAEALRQSDAVFRGRVVASDKAGRGDDERLDLRFEVDAVYKGNVFRDQVVATATNSGSCGLTPDIGTTWVIFAREGIKGEGNDAVARLITDSCSGDLPTSSAPLVLGTARPPQDGESDREERAVSADRAVSRGLKVFAFTALGLLGLTTVGLALAWRKPRP